MTRDEAVSDITETIRRLEDDDVETVASVIVQALMRVNGRKVAAGETAGSGWRQGVQAEIYKKL